MAKQKADDKKMTKAEAVRQAVANGHAMPKAGAAYIKSEFGIDISTGTFSATKSQQGKKRSKPKGGVDPVGISHPKTKMNGDIAQSIEAIKSLVESLGVDQVKRIAEVFRK